MAPSPVLPKLVGQRVKRREDPRLIQGLGTYVDDIKLVGMQHLAFKRCDIAHGRITSLDTSAAEVMDGVEAVFSGAQIAEFLAPMPIGTPFPSPDHRAVANDVVRYVGEPVAVVVARDRYVARDAADAIRVEYEELPAVIDPEEAGNNEERPESTPDDLMELGDNDLEVLSNLLLFLILGNFEPSYSYKEYSNKK